MKIKRTLLLSLVCLLAAAGQAREKIRVACVGNSVTYGYLLKDREHTSYPAQLSRLAHSRHPRISFCP